VAETTAILAPSGIEVVPVARKVDEIQSHDIEVLVRDKCIKAFRMIGRPLFVEHTGLSIAAMNGFPGGLTKIFWDTVGPERVTALFGQGGRAGATARTQIGYCDGGRVHQFAGEIAGRIAPEPRGGDVCEWDCVFIPEGEERTFAEIGEAKNEISMRRRALDEFLRFLQENVATRDMRDAR
jgi:XTP/dITP diphosphohydrolase